MSEISLGFITAFAVAGVSLYFPINRVRAPGRWFFQDTWFDTYIPLVPYFIIPYLALFPYMIVGAYSLWNTAYTMQFALSVALASWSAAFVWYFFPAGILRKHKIRPDFFSRMLVWIYENEPENNTFPSSHVFYALIFSYYLALALPSFAYVFALCGFLISISTVLVKQHHFADIMGGILWAVGAILIAQILVA